jgi:hypothetical protein
MAGGPLCTRPPLLRPLRSDLGVGVEHPELAVSSTDRRNTF